MVAFVYFFPSEVIIQDAVVLMDEYLHSLFQDPLFSRHDFVSYKQSLNEHMVVAQNPINMEIQRIMPELCRHYAEQ
jgi:uncharacterized protein YqgQ